jgi:hypothetical protein
VCEGLTYSTVGQCQQCDFPNIISADHRSCPKCDAGHEANATRTGCQACQPGTFSTAGLCRSCAPGKEPTADHITCIACGAGRAGADGECRQCEDGKSPSVTAMACDPCPTGRAGVDGQCSGCDTGTEPSTNHTACVACAAGKFSTGVECQHCESGKQPNVAGIGCDACPEGHTSDLGSAGCTLCLPGYYSYFDNVDCRLCGDLKLPVTLVNKDDPINMALPEVCPGGKKSLAVIMPQTQLWVHVGATHGEMELIGCEHEAACVSLATVNSTLTEWLGQSPASTPAHSRRLQMQQLERHTFGAHCGVGYKTPPNFLCGKCADGYVKIAGSCVECDAFDWSMLVSSLAVYMVLTPLFLLHKSTKLVVSKIEIRKIWDKVCRSARPVTTSFLYESLWSLLDSKRGLI